jgi:hypothetical protein
MHVDVTGCMKKHMRGGLIKERISQERFESVMGSKLQSIILML